MTSSSPNLKGVMGEGAYSYLLQFQGSDLLHSGFISPTFCLDSTAISPTILMYEVNTHISYKIFWIHKFISPTINLSNSWNSYFAIVFDPYWSERFSMKSCIIFSGQILEAYIFWFLCLILSSLQTLETSKFSLQNIQTWKYFRYLPFEHTIQTFGHKSHIPFS